MYIFPEQEDRMRREENENLGKKTRVNIYNDQKSDKPTFWSQINTQKNFFKFWTRDVNWYDPDAKCKEARKQLLIFFDNRRANIDWYTTRMLIGVFLFGPLKKKSEF